MKAKGVLGALLVVPALTMSMMFASGGGGKDGGDEKKADGPVPIAVPREYEQDVVRAGKICPEISGAVIAVQIGKESSWQPQAKSKAGAMGLAQFMPDTWRTVGKDGDGDGKADVMNPHDAIYSQGHFMCSLAEQMKKLIAAGKVKGEVVNLALAAYNAGPGAVEEYGGIPPFTETQNYVQQITQRVAQAKAGGGGGSGDGSRASKILAMARSKIGKPYVWGAASDDVGYDCSGLVQVAYAAAGIELAHSSATQCTAGSRVSQDQAQPGDLVCWSGHVAIYAGNNTIVEAATEGIPVRETTVYQMAGGPYYVHIN